MQLKDKNNNNAQRMRTERERYGTEIRRFEMTLIWNASQRLDFNGIRVDEAASERKEKKTRKTKDSPEID